MRDSPHDIERACGLELYLTDAPGGGGSIKREPGDFVVEEVPEKDGEGDHTLFTLEKRDWETNHLLRDMARELGVSRKRFGFAGFKDKRATTRQRMSIRGVEAERLKNLDLKNVEITDVRTGARVERGALLGNRFTITITDGDEDAFRTVQAQVESAGGVPNFFGIQRFGAQRPITHRVGEAIVKGDFEEAAKIYVAEDWPYERQDAREARQRIAEEWGAFDEAFDYFPGRLRYERAILHGLADGKDYREALDELPRNLVELFVHAHQSHIYNRVICERIRRDLPLNRAVEGDIVCFTDLDTGLPNRYVTERVKPYNQEKLNTMIDAGKAFVTAPLPGTDTELAQGEPGEAERTVVDQHYHDFAVPEWPRLSSRGMRRELLLTVVPELDGSRFEFFLPKGCYATTVLREYMKTDPLKMI